MAQGPGQHKYVRSQRSEPKAGLTPRQKETSASPKLGLKNTHSKKKGVRVISRPKKASASSPPRAEKNTQRPKKNSVRVNLHHEVNVLRVRVKDSTSKKGVRVNLCCEVNVLRVRALGLGLGSWLIFLHFKLIFLH